GLGLTGIPVQLLFFHYGLGANGKSVFLEVLARVFGALGEGLPAESITGQAQGAAGGASPDLARLPGVRFLRITELPQGRMWRVRLDGEPTPVFLLAAREIDDSHDDEARSLAAITEATRQALWRVEALGYTKALMGLLAAGPSRTDAASYCLVAQLSGIRYFAAGATTAEPGLHSVGIYILDDDAWSDLMQGRIPVLDLLTSQLARVLVRVWASGEPVEEFALSVPHGTSIGEVLKIYHVEDTDIRIAARPWPVRGIAERRSLPIFPGMVIDVFSSTFESRVDA
ncbi:hypothetical protein WDZ92_42685, partial [Nostoc sp. NIES-2111]